MLAAGASSTRFGVPVLFVSLYCVAALGADGPLSITNYQFVSKQDGPGQSFVTYRADLVNSGRALETVAATLSTLDPATIRVAPGQGVLKFGPVRANSQV